jgi:type I restriction enzyme M protein
LFIINDVQMFKSILKSCHHEIRNNEGCDPTVAFDEMSKVLFCKLYEEKHASERSGNNRFRLSVYDDTLERIGVNVVKQILSETKNDPRYSGLFFSETSINLQDRTIRKIVSLFENYDLSLTAFDVRGLWIRFKGYAHPRLIWLNNLNYCSQELLTYFQNQGHGKRVSTLRRGSGNLLWLP